MLDLKALEAKELNLLAMFGKALSMSTSSWSSGNCTITGISNYLVVMFVDNNNNFLVGALVDGTFRAFALSGQASQYGQVMAGTYSGDACTLTYAKQMTHTQSGNHGASSNITIKACYGLVPVVGGVVRKLLNSLKTFASERRWVTC